MVNDWSKYKNFSEDEFECGCGCGVSNMNEDVVACLQSMSDYICEHTGNRMPISIERGASCFQHNLAIGGSITSSHIADEDKESYAVDIRCETVNSRYWLLRSAFGLFRRIGLYNKHNGIHLDLDPHKAKNITWKV